MRKSTSSIDDLHIIATDLRLAYDARCQEAAALYQHDNKSAEWTAACDRAAYLWGCLQDGLCEVRRREDTVSNKDSRQDELLERRTDGLIPAWRWRWARA